MKWKRTDTISATCNTKTSLFFINKMQKLLKCQPEIYKINSLKE